jgi:hypothetical protein
VINVRRQADAPTAAATTTTTTTMTMTHHSKLLKVLGHT